MLKINFNQPPPTIEDIKKETSRIIINKKIGSFLLFMDTISIFSLVIYGSFYHVKYIVWSISLSLLILISFIWNKKADNDSFNIKLLERKYPSSVSLYKDIKNCCEKNYLYLNYVKKVFSQPRDLTFLEANLIIEEFNKSEHEALEKNKYKESEEEFKKIEKEILNIDNEETYIL